MLLPAVNQNAVTSNFTGQQQKMSMVVSGKAFHILAGQLYKHKILAIVRELSTNAWDAHQEANNLSKPFDIQLPTELNPIFRIRDYGTGMDEQTIFDTYNCLFASTKSNTNTAVGCLGLGSKTPFSYTSVVTVSSYRDGKLSTYVSNMGADGIPNLTKVFEVPTQEPNGLEVQFAVEKKDFDEFAKAAERVCTTFLEGSRPNIVNTKLDAEEISSRLIKVCDNLYFGLKSVTKYFDNVNLIQGNVCYPLNPTLLPKNYRDTLYHIDLSKYSAFITVPIGTVDFQPSREGLTESKDNYDRIDPYLGELDNHFKAVFTENFKDIVDSYTRALWLGQRAAGKFRNQLFSKEYLERNLKSKKIPVRHTIGWDVTTDLRYLKEQLEIEIKNAKGYSIGQQKNVQRIEFSYPSVNLEGPSAIERYDAERGRRDYYYRAGFNGNLTREVPPGTGLGCHIRIPDLYTAVTDSVIIVVDEPKKFRSKINYHFGSDTVKIILVKAKGNDDLVKRFIAHLPKFKVVKTSELSEAPIVPVTNRAPRIKHRWFQVVTRPHRVGRDELVTAESLGLTASTKFYYIVMQSYGNYYPKFGSAISGDAFNQDMAYLVEQGIIDNRKMVLVRDFHAEKLATHYPNGKPLYETIEKAIKAKYDKEAVTELIKWSTYMNSGDAKIRLSKIFDCLPSMKQANYLYWEEYRDIKSKIKSNFYDKVHRTIDLASMFTVSKVSAGVYDKLLADITKAYPLVTGYHNPNLNAVVKENVCKLLKKETPVA